MRKWIRLGLLSLIAALLLGACVWFFFYAPKHVISDPPMIVEESIKPPEFEVISSSMPLQDDIKTWVEENKHQEGLYSKVLGSDQFVLLSGGEKSSTGFGIALTKIVGTKETVEMAFKTLSPVATEKIEPLITYPRLLLRLKHESRKVVLVS